MPFVAVSNVGLFDHVGPACAVPDMLLSMNVTVRQDQEKKENRSYFIWVFGKPPDVVVEVVSNKVGGEGSKKSKKYAKLGISYYVVFDPFGYVNKELLHVYELQGKRYRRRKDNQLPGVQLKAVIWEGEVSGLTRKWLRWATPDGTLLLRGQEMAMREHQRADQAELVAVQDRQRAEKAEQLAETERQLKERAEQRTKLLAEKLRTLGIDADVPE